MSVAEFMTLVRKHYNIDVTRDQCYKAKKRIQGSIEEQYSKLWDYCEELKRQNPGSTVLVKTSLRGDDPVFERLYICLDQLRKGFIDGCRTMVGFDGAFIKGQHPGQLLSAVGIDANNGMFPIAFAIVETESRDTWTWFLEIFFNDVGVRDTGHGWVFITDKQKGLGQAIEALKPDAEHRHCVRHLHNNFKLAGHGSLALKQRLWAAARKNGISVDLCGIPCYHGLAAISRQQRSPMTYVNEVYKREAYDKAYSNYISPMPSQQLWRKSGHRPIKPPLYHKQSGRPKKARNRPVDEIPKGATKLRRYGIVIHCSVWGGEGHNATNCGRADGNMGRGKGRGRGRGRGRGTSLVHPSEEE
ncbi:unnamed protein product [Prunus brigantina]